MSRNCGKRTCKKRLGGSVFGASRTAKAQINLGLYRSHLCLLHPAAGEGACAPQIKKDDLAVNPANEHKSIFIRVYSRNSRLKRSQSSTLDEVRFSNCLRQSSSSTNAADWRQPAFTLTNSSR